MKRYKAVHQNQRIERGMVYWLEYNGRRLYFRPSIERFVRDGDGRVPLTASAPQNDVASQAKAAQPAAI